eukprot:14385269-Alexandrium_andersonii.AAC.1
MVQRDALERLSPTWARAVLEWRQASRWWIELVASFADHRRATFAFPGGERVCRPVLTGVRAGGPTKH